MNEAQKEALILDYLEGNLTEEERREFKGLVEAGIIRQLEVDQVQQVLFTFAAMPTPEPGVALQKKFNTMLAAQIEKEEMAKPHLSWAALWGSLTQLLNPVSVAYTMLIFAGGFLSAWLLLFSLQPPAPDNQELAAELRQVKQLLFATLIEQPAAVDRLKAVNFSQEIADADGKVIEALFRSLNEDDNVNVRLAAIEALRGHTSNPAVREKLILSINRQESPIVQIALADLMQALQEKKALPQLKRLLENEETNDMVKEKIKESINLLI